MAKERIHELPQTRGSYQVRGNVFGVEKQNFYSEKTTKSGNAFRMVNFGVEYDDKKTIFVDLNGMPRDKVYMSKRNDAGKTETKAVEWKNRNKKDADGYRLIGINLGLSKTLDSNGKEVNDKKTLVEFDACEYIRDNLVDGESVFVKGNIDFSSFTNKNGDVNRRTKYVPSQISLCKDVDFDEEGYKPVNNFTQTIVFVGIEKEVIDEKETGRFIVEAKIVNYNSIESAQFVVENKTIANTFKKNLKPYYALEVFGNIVASIETETEEVDDGWGGVNPMTRVNSPVRRELVIMGGNPATIDKETYTEELINEAIRKQNAARQAEQNFNGSVATPEDVDWGSSDVDDDEPW